MGFHSAFKGLKTIVTESGQFVKIQTAVRTEPKMSLMKLSR